MTCVAIIPARGGSKRLPNKNILPILKKPMISYPITAARNSKLFDQVIVSTEEKKIGEIGRQNKARVMVRPKELATDDATVVQVCEHVLKTLEDEGVLPQFFCCVYATAVFITKQDLKQSFLLMAQHPDTEVVMGVSKFNLQPAQALEGREDNTLGFKWPEYTGLKSQFQPDLCASNGTLYWARTGSFLKNPTFYPEKLRGYPIPWIRAIDLDTPEDYSNAQLLAPLMLNRE